MTQITCKECGNQYPEELKECNACGCPNNIESAIDSPNTDSKTETIAVNAVKEKSGSLKKWLEVLSFVILALILIVTVSLKIGQNDAANQKWEYKTLVFTPTENNERVGEGSEAYNTILPSEADMDQLGSEGWELVTSYLEMETAYPNFGNEEYVTGIQPNVRPQSVVLIFKRSASGDGTSDQGSGE